jgi:hypothetical protein
LIFLGVTTNLRYLLTYRTFALASLLIWLIVSWSGMHGHFCLDGSEPPLSVHSVHTTLAIDNSDHGHTDDHHDVSHGGQTHVDVDIKLSQWLSVKLLKIDLPLLIALVFLFVALLAPRQILAGFYAFHTCSHRSGLRPPLRAPPAFPA